MDSEVGVDNENEIDFSIIRSAIRLRGRMIEQIFNGVHYGSPEVRNLLLNECDIILECKVCRSLFRSLPNLVAHKRVYCNQEYTKYCSGLEVEQKDSEDIIVVDPCENDGISSVTYSEKNSVVDKLIDGSFEGKSQAYKLYTKAAERVELSREKSGSSVQLTPIDSNPNAVTQKVVQSSEVKENQESKSSTESKTMGRRQKNVAVKKDSTLVPGDKKHMKLTAMKKKNLQMNLRKRTQGESKKDTPPSTSKSALEKRNKSSAGKENSKAKHLENLKVLKKPVPLTNEQVDLANKQCLACKEKYTSVRSLRAHIDRMHGKCTRFSYPCPQCDSKFKYLWNVVRHLLLVHKKTKAQVDKMRPKLKKSVVKDNPVNTHAVEKTKMKTDQEHTTEDAKKKKKVKKPDDVATKKEQNIKKGNSKGARKVKIMVDELDKLKAQTKSPHFKSGGHIHLCEYCQNPFWKEENLRLHVEVCLKNPNAIPVEKETAMKRKLENDDELIDEAVSPKKMKSETVPEDNKRDDNSSQVEGVQYIIVTAEEQESCSTAGENDTEHQQKLRKSRPVLKPRRERLERIESPLCIDEEPKKEDVYEFVEEDLSANTVLTDEQKHELGLLDQQDSLPSVRLVEEIWVDKEPGKPLQKVKSSRAYVLEEKRTAKTSCQDQKKIQHIIDEDKLICLKCNQTQTSISNLRRHAVRHLGWKRYECKCCTFTSYNKSEITRHITKCHSSQIKKYSLAELIVDLQEAGEKLRTQKKLQTISDKQLQSMYNPTDFVVTYPPKKASTTTYYVCKPNDRKKPGVSAENIQEPSFNKFNISTRNSPREFDMRPYQRVDKMETMCTRKGYYPKKGGTSESSKGDSEEEQNLEDDFSTIETSHNAMTTELVEKMMENMRENPENNVTSESKITSKHIREQKNSETMDTASCKDNENGKNMKEGVNSSRPVKEEWVDVETYEPDEPHMTEANIFYDSGDEAMEHRDDVEGDHSSNKVTKEKPVTEGVKTQEIGHNTEHSKATEENSSAATCNSIILTTSTDGTTNTVQLCAIQNVVDSANRETLEVDRENENSQTYECQVQEIEYLSNNQSIQEDSVASSRTPPSEIPSSVSPCIQEAEMNKFGDTGNMQPASSVTEKIEPSSGNDLTQGENVSEHTGTINSDDLQATSSQYIPSSIQEDVLVDQSNSYIVQTTENPSQLSESQKVHVSRAQLITVPLY